MANNATVQGIDVSHYQGTVNWTAVKNAGIGYAFAKATDGNTYVDTQFQTNWAGIKAAGLLRGAYHFYESNDDPVTQANNFIKTVGSLATGDLPPVIDIEAYKGDFGSTTLVANVQTWLNTVEQALGCTPMIYTGPSFWNQYMNNSFSRYALWVAQYGVTQPKLPNGWSKWTFWQNSESGTVAGVTGNVDTDIFAGSMADLQAFARNK
ncbi:glycoside hydrolase family 25 protein [Undibacterium sp. JH2W]|uniref:glycoside hydrolase family 25 protein n=1 Tax=Undibacterium sp. JH2W TaxID=3413037 RepID=UPI003BF07286